MSLASRFQNIEDEELRLRVHKNVAIVLGCLAEKLAGARSIALFRPETLEFLLSSIDPSNDSTVILFSLIALEKFAQTSENKLTIQQRLLDADVHPLLALEAWAKEAKNNEDDPIFFVRRQVQFCAQWCLDNLCKS